MSATLGAGTALYNALLHGQITLEEAKNKKANFTPEQAAEFGRLELQFGKVI